jgi:hypothetical protein
LPFKWTANIDFWLYDQKYRQLQYSYKYGHRIPYYPIQKTLQSLILFVFSGRIVGTLGKG